MAWIDGIPGKSYRNEFPLVGRVLADDPFIGCLLPMPYSIGNLLRIIPLFHPEGNGPSPLDHLGLGDLFPFASALDFQGCLAWFTLLEGIKLSRQLQGLGMNRIKSEANDLIPGDFRNGKRVYLFFLLGEGRDRKR